MILGAKMVPKLVKNAIENMIDFWSAPGRDLNGLWVGTTLFRLPLALQAGPLGRGKGRGLVAISLAKRARS